MANSCAKFTSFSTIQQHVRIIMLLTQNKLKTVEIVYILIIALTAFPCYSASFILLFYKTVIWFRCSVVLYSIEIIKN